MSSRDTTKETQLTLKTKLKDLARKKMRKGLKLELRELRHYH